MKLKKKFVIIFFLFFFLNLPFLGFSQRELEVTYPYLTGVELPTLGTPVESETVARYLRYFFNFAIFSGIIFSFVIFVFAGFRYLYSAGNPQIKSDAKNQILAAFFGIVLLLVSYHLLALFNPEFVFLNPFSLDAKRLFMNFSRRPRRVNFDELIQRLQPTQIPLELIYPEIRGFRPSIIPFTESLPHYPLDQLIAQYINYIYNWAIVLGIILAFVFLVLGGIKYLSSAGNPSLVGEAKAQILASLLGLILLLASFGILRAFRPEFTRIEPEELPELEIEIPEGVYLCTERAPMIGGDDLFERYIKNEFNKKIGGGSTFPFTKKVKAELELFVQLFCHHLTNSQNLPPEIMGGQFQVTSQQIEEMLKKIYGEDIPGLTDEEKQEIIAEFSQPVEYPGAQHLYINGEYGVIFHGEKDFKGYAIVYFPVGHSASAPAFPHLVSIRADATFFYRNLQAVFDVHPPASITIFEDRVLSCWIRAEKDHFGRADISECLGIRDIVDDRSILFFPLPDFGGFEEKKEEIKEYYIFVFSPDKFGGIMHGLGNLRLFSEVTETLFSTGITGGPGHCDPCYSFKLPSEGNWIVVASISLNPLMSDSPTAVFNKSQRNLEETYARALRCNHSPCIFTIFVWPGTILKPTH